MPKLAPHFVPVVNYLPWYCGDLVDEGRITQLANHRTVRFVSFWTFFVRSLCLKLASYTRLFRPFFTPQNSAFVSVISYLYPLSTAPINTSSFYSNT